MYVLMLLVNNTVTSYRDIGLCNKPKLFTIGYFYCLIFVYNCYYNAYWTEIRLLNNSTKRLECKQTRKNNAHVMNTAVCAWVM